MKEVLKLIRNFLDFESWEWVHVKVGTKNGKNEIYITNPTLTESQTPVIEEVVKPETLSAKIERFRNAKPNELTPEEESWWKERQLDLEKSKIGQIVPEDSPEVALAKMNALGIT